MLQMTVKIVKNSGDNWVLQVNCVRPSGPPYFFQKDGFKTSDEAKRFLMINMRLFAQNMGEV
jgi:hypothetical protein